MLAIGLRFIKGVDLSTFEHRFAAPPPSVHRKLTELEKAGLITLSGSKIKLTKRGQLVYDSVAEELIVA